jgi:hypothetical protein
MVLNGGLVEGLLASEDFEAAFLLESVWVLKFLWI